MFYDEQGKYVRTKKEIVDENGNVRKGCRIVKKGDIYEHKIFTIKNTQFKQEAFLDEVKKFYTDRINFLAVNEKDKLEVFDRGGPYLATKKIGKNNPMEQEIKSDKERNTSLEIPPEASKNPLQKASVDQPYGEIRKAPRQIPPQPELPDILSRLPELQRVNKLIEDWDSSIHFMEQKKQSLKMELAKCIGVFKSARRKELQDEITEADSQISYLKKRRASTAKENGFDTIKAFRQEYKGVKAEYDAYKNALSRWEKTYGIKAVDETSIEGKIEKHQKMEKEEKVLETTVFRNHRDDRGAR